MKSMVHLFKELKGALAQLDSSFEPICANQKEHLASLQNDLVAKQSAYAKALEAYEPVKEEMRQLREIQKAVDYVLGTDAQDSSAEKKDAPEKMLPEKRESVRSRLEMHKKQIAEAEQNPKKDRQGAER